MNSPTIAVVFAGGKGTRLANQSQPKQFVAVGGKPIIAWTLGLLQDSPEIAAIYLVSIESHMELMNEIVTEHKFSKVKNVVPGGEYAMESIFIGLDAAVQDGNPSDSVVLIHDGVRPIINQDLIREVAASVRLHGNGITSNHAFETLAESNDGGNTVSEVTERSKMFTLQAPQAFKLGPIHSAHKLAKQVGVHDKVVDQAHLIHSLRGQEIDQSLNPLRLVSGLKGNIKITTADEINYFEFLLESGKYHELTSATKNTAG